MMSAETPIGESLQNAGFEAIHAETRYRLGESEPDTAVPSSPKPSVRSASVARRYRHLKAKVGKTRLMELVRVGVPNANRLFAKLEYRNPGGSHYDRVYCELLLQLESCGQIKPGKTRLVETTTGNAGVSFAWIASELGYECSVVIPADVAETRKRQILDRGADLILSPAGEYVQGAIRTLRRYLLDHKAECRSGEIYCVNHSQDPRSVSAVASIADEIVLDLKVSSTLETDSVILGCGNGTTILGLGARLKHLIQGSRCIAFDPFEAPVAFERKFPGRYEREFGVKPESQPHLHRILGTGGWGVHFPLIASPQFLATVDDVCLVRDEEMTHAQSLLAEREHVYPGRSSAAAVAVALRIAGLVRQKNIVVIFYDELNYYPGTS